MAVNPQAAVALLQNAIPEMPSLGIVLGSGFQTILEGLAVESRFPFSGLPGFHLPTVPGHEQAAILVATVGGRRVVLISGRMHYYEGHSMATVTLPVRVLARCGVRTLVLTNAAGGIREDFRVGDLVCLTDHLNFIGVNPLRDSSSSTEVGFVDLCDLYSERVNQRLTHCGRRHGFQVHRGVYVAVAGPSFETPAEIRMFERLGGDLIGMSTVPEAVASRQCGLEVAALAFITNLAAGRSHREIRHEEVLEVLSDAGDRLAKLIADFCREVE
ncbi:MAG: Purine nucleoside phosphorylase 1 [Verrucomicrobia subdivision 3 bacterium]|nr:Purine nucleoside phosphorylase 1 [Limisphaerales bacterium]MCS1413730.1 Purine nucleoside phosphorylase 1 [Limisphaerales bacterium]